MMYPPFAKVDYKKLGKVFKDKTAIITSIIASWFVGQHVCLYYQLYF